jgi:hypothetical protein
MAKATIMQDPREVDLRFRGIFMTEWDTVNDTLGEVAQREDISTNTYRVGELFAGLTSAPESYEGAEYSQYAPQPGKSWIVTTGIYKFAFRASDYLRRYGNSDQVMQYPVIGSKIFEHTIKTQVYNMYNRAFDVSYPGLYDTTQPLCSNSHVLANGGTASNAPTAADLAEPSLATAIELMVRTPNEDGVYIGRAPKTLLLNTMQWANATKITQSTLTGLQGTGESGNYLNAISRAWNIVPHFSPYITDTDAWFLIAPDAPVKTVFSQAPEVKPVFVDPMTEDWVWRFYGEFSTVADTWRGVVGSPGA